MSNSLFEKIIKELQIGNSLNPNEAEVLKTYLKTGVLKPKDETVCDSKTIVIKSTDDHIIKEENTPHLIYLFNGHYFFRDPQIKEIFLREIKEKINQGAEKIILKMSIPNRIVKKDGVYYNFLFGNSIFEIIDKTYPQIKSKTALCYLRSGHQVIKMEIDFMRFGDITSPAQ